MTITDILILLLAIIGIAGIGWIIIALLLFLYGWIESALMRRRIPEKVKKEVENDRLKRQSRREDFRRQYSSGGESEVERGTPSPGFKTIQEVDNEHDADTIGGDDEVEGWSEPVRRKSSWRRI